MDNTSPPYKRVNPALGKNRLLFGFELSRIVPFLFFIAAGMVAVTLYELAQILLIETWNPLHERHRPGWLFWVVSMSWCSLTWLILTFNNNWRYISKFIARPQWGRGHLLYQPWLTEGRHHENS